MPYLVRRLLLAVLQLIAVAFASFALFTLVPGDYYTAAQADPRQSNQTLDSLRQSRPSRSFGQWLNAAAAGDFGTSIAYGIPVRRLLAPRIAKTLAIALPALLLAWIVAATIAMLAARARWLPIETPTAAGAMIPDIVGVSLLIWIAVSSGLPIDSALLPIAALAITLLPAIVLHAGTQLREADCQDFVRLAKSRGINGARLSLRYLLPAAANPLVSLAGLSIASSVSASFVVEVLTGWPGLGSLFLEAVQARDYPIVETVILLLAAVLISANLAVDLFLYNLDPRMRTPHA